MLAFHKELLRLRKSMPALRSLKKDTMSVSSFEEDRVLAVRRWNEASEVLVIFHFNDRLLNQFRGIPTGVWRKCFDSSQSRWMGSGIEAPPAIGAAESSMTLQPYAVLAYVKETQPE